jgi:outer membrane protein
LNATIRRTAGRAAVLASVFWLGLGWAASLEAQGGGGAKLGVIDVRRILTESKAGRKALDELRALAKTRQDELADRESEVAALRKRIDDGRLSLSPEKQQELDEELQAKLIDLRRAEDDARRKMDERQGVEFGKIEDRVMPLIKAIGEEQGFTLIFNKFEDSGLLFATDGADITDEVLRRFDALPEASDG